MQPKDPDSIPLAEIVEPGYSSQTPSQPKTSNCLLIGALVVGGVSIFLVGIGFLFYFVVQRMVDQFPGNDQARNVVGQDLDLASVRKEFDSELQGDQEQLEIAAFAERLSKICDETANVEIQKLIDYQKYANRAEDYTKRIGKPLYYPRLIVLQLREHLAGPSPFSSYQIVSVRKLTSDTYAVFLICQSDYADHEPMVWWVTDRHRNLKIYDWWHIEQGLPASHETAEISLALDGFGYSAYERYVGLCEEYYAESTEEQTLDEIYENAVRILLACEALHLPTGLVDTYHLFTAIRWYQLDENDRALALLKRVDGAKAPGKHRLVGDIYRDEGDYEKAVQEYEVFASLVGRNPHALRWQADCYRQLGQFENEMAKRLELVRYSNDFDARNLQRILQAGDDDQVEVALKGVELLPDRNDIYYLLLSGFGESPFGLGRLELIRSHLVNCQAPSHLIEYADVKRELSEGEISDPLAVLATEGPQADEIRSEIWTRLARQGRLFEVLEKTENPVESFGAIQEVYEFADEYGYVSPEQFLDACQLIAENDPELYQPLFLKGRISQSQGNDDLAIKSLTRAKELVDDDRVLETINYMLLDSHQRSSSAEITESFALDNDLVENLIRLRMARNDLIGAEKLLEGNVELESDLVYIKARLLWKRGEKEKAIATLAPAVAKLSEEDQLFYNNPSMLLLAEWCDDLGSPMRAMEFCPSFPMLETLLDRLVAQREWEGCHELLKWSEGKFEKDVIVAKQLELGWESGDYNAVLDLVNLHGTDQLNYTTFSYAVRSAVRAGKLGKAEEWAALAQKEFEINDLAAMVAFKQGDIDKAIEFLDQCTEYEQSFYLNDVDLQGLGLREAKRLMGRQPERLYEFQNSQRYSLLYSSPQAVNAKLLAERLKPQLGNIEFVEVEYFPGESLWVGNTESGYRVCVRQAETVADRWRNLPGTSDLKQAFENSGSLITIGISSRLPSQNDRSFELGARVANLFKDENCSALGNDSVWLTPSQFSSFIEKLESKSCYRDVFSRLGTTMYEEDPVTPEDFTRQKKFDLELARASEKFTKSSDAQFTVHVYLNSSGDLELIPVRVNEVSVGDYFYGNFVGELERDSLISPNYLKGTQVRFSDDLVVRFRLKCDGELIEATYE